MRSLVIDTATAACSAAILADGAVIASGRETVGRGHAERLMPMIAALLADAKGTKPDRVLVDCGPGSFTGVRVGLAAAIGLGIGWGVPVLGYSSCLAIAAALFDERADCTACAVAMGGGHGELFVQRFARALRATSDLVSLPPAAAATIVSEPIIAGSGAAALVAARGDGVAIDALPDAAAVRLLGEADLLPARPIYGRAPDARPKAA